MKKSFRVVTTPFRGRDTVRQMVCNHKTNIFIQLSSFYLA